MNRWSEKFRTLLVLGREEEGMTPTLEMMGVGIVVCGALVALWSPIKALMLIVAAATLLLAWVRPTWLLLMLLAYIPLEPFLLKFVPCPVGLKSR